MTSDLSSSKNIFSLFPLFLVLIIDAMGFGIVFPLTGSLFLAPGGGLLPDSWSVDLRELCYSLSIASFFIFILIGSPFIGDLSDKWGRKRVVLTCLFGTSLAYLFCVIAILVHSILLFLFGRCLAGFLAGSQAIAQAAIIDISSPKDKTKNLAFITLASCLGFSVGPILGGVFANNHFFAWASPHVPFLIAALIAFLNGIGLICLFQETYQVKKIVEPMRISKVFSMLKEAWTNRAVRFLCGLFLLMQLGWALFYQYLAIYLVQVLNYSTMKIGLFNAAIGCLFSITLLFVMRALLRFFSVPALTLYMFLVQGISTLVFPLVTNEMSLWLLLIPVTIAVGASYTCLLTLYSEAVSTDRQGWVMGVSEAIMAIAWIISSIFIANNRFFYSGSLFYLAAGMAILGAFLSRRPLSNAPKV